MESPEPVTVTHVNFDIETMINIEGEEKATDANANTESGENSNGIDRKQKNPLENSLIIDYVFTLLDLADIKQCRLVCSQWNEHSIPFIEKMALVTIGCIKGASAVNNRSLSSFNELFTTSSATFGSFKLKFQSSPESLWSLPVLAEFFKNHDARELTIDRIRFSQVQPTIFNIDSLIDKKLTHLTIRSTLRNIIEISIQTLKTVKFLSLLGCRLSIEDNCQLAPAKFEMNSVVVMKEGAVVNNLFFNDILTFENLKELKLCNGTYANQTINLDSKITVDNLTLDGVNVQNCFESKWQINKTLTLKNISYQKPNQLQFSDLTFGGSLIKLKALTPSLQKLTLDSTAENMHIEIPAILNLPNLKYLEWLIKFPCCLFCPHSEEDQHLIFRAFPLQFIEVFQNCSNLSTIKLDIRTRTVDCLLRLDVFWIPPSVRNIFLIGDFEAYGGIRPLEKLVIENSKLEYLTQNLDCLPSEHLVLNLESISVSKLQELILLFIEIPYKSVAIGSLKGNMCDFQRSRLPEFVDKKSQYYCFDENKNGRAISEYEFKKKVEQQ